MIQPTSQSVYGSALQGINSARSLALNAAIRIGNGDLDDLAGSMVDLMRARHIQAANLKVLETQQQMDKDVLDIIA